jgi:hypothetical protein
MKVAKHFITAPPTDQANNNICINVDTKQGHAPAARREMGRDISRMAETERVGPRNVNLYCHWRLDVGRVAPDPRTSAQHSVRHLKGARLDRLARGSDGAGAILLGKNLLEEGNWILEVGE